MDVMDVINMKIVKCSMLLNLRKNTPQKYIALWVFLIFKSSYAFAFDNSSYITKIQPKEIRELIFELMNKEIDDNTQKTEIQNIKNLYNNINNISLGIEPDENKNIYACNTIPQILFSFNIFYKKFSEKHFDTYDFLNQCKFIKSRDVKEISKIGNVSFRPETHKETIKRIQNEAQLFSTNYKLRSTFYNEKKIISTHSYKLLTNNFFIDLLTRSAKNIRTDEKVYLIRKINLNFEKKYTNTEIENLNNHFKDGLEFIMNNILVNHTEFYKFPTNQEYLIKRCKHSTGGYIITKADFPPDAIMIFNLKDNETDTLIENLNRDKTSSDKSCSLYAKDLYRYIALKAYYDNEIKRFIDFYRKIDNYIDQSLILSEVIFTPNVKNWILDSDMKKL